MFRGRGGCAADELQKSLGFQGQDRSPARKALPGQGSRREGPGRSLPAAGKPGS